MQALSITELPWDVLAHIFKRVPTRGANATRLATVCRTFRRVCHAHATTAIIARPYEPQLDGATLATLALLPQLRAVDLSERAISDACSWPLSALTTVTRLTAWESWQAKEVPPALAVLTVEGPDNQRVHARQLDELLALLPAGCCVRVPMIACHADSEYSMVAGWAQRVLCSEIFVTFASLACLRGLAPSRLTTARIYRGTGLKTVDGIGHCSALRSLSISHCSELTSLQFLAQARFHYKPRRLHGCVSLVPL